MENLDILKSNLLERMDKLQGKIEDSLKDLTDKIDKINTTVTETSVTMTYYTKAHDDLKLRVINCEKEITKLTPKNDFSELQKSYFLLSRKIAFYCGACAVIAFLFPIALKYIL